MPLTYVKLISLMNSYLLPKDSSVTSRIVIASKRNTDLIENGEIYWGWYHINFFLEFYSFAHEPSSSMSETLHPSEAVSSHIS
jgi:hypothetical protein